MIKLLKNLLDEFDQIGVISFIKDKEGKNVLMQQSICDSVERSFNGKYIELGNKDDSNITNILLCNNPNNIISDSINDSEESISLHYNDVVINMMGYKNSK